MSQQTFEPLLTAENASVLLGIHPVTLFRWAREGRVPSIRYGRAVRFRASAIDTWLDGQNVKYTDSVNRAASTGESEAA